MNENPIRTDISDWTAVPQLSHSVDEPTVAAFLQRAGLAGQKFPERVELVDDVPRTASGKVQKNV